mgnify:CR=1 FL=1
MRVLVIENEYDSILPVFNAVEKIVLKQPIEKVHIDKSQNIPWNELTSFNAIFIDLSLATKSMQDGYGIIEKFKEQAPEVLSKIAIITGNDMVRESLKERGLSECNIQVFEKPLRYKEIAAFIK